MKIKNETDEEIVIPPGGIADVFGSVDRDKVMAGRRKSVIITGVREGTQDG